MSSPSIPLQSADGLQPHLLEHAAEAPHQHQQPPPTAAAATATAGISLRGVSSSSASGYSASAAAAAAQLVLLTEEERLIFNSEGLPVPTQLPLSPHEVKALKRIRRKIKNKWSAQESRRKKKEYMESLEKKVDQYAFENSGLRRRVDQLEGSNRSLLVQLRHLQQSCVNATAGAAAAAAAAVCRSRPSAVTTTTAPAGGGATTSTTTLAALVLCFALFFAGPSDFPPSILRLLAGVGHGGGSGRPSGDVTALADARLFYVSGGGPRPNAPQVAGRRDVGHSRHHGPPSSGYYSSYFHWDYSFHRFFTASDPYRGDIASSSSSSSSSRLSFYRAAGPALPAEAAASAADGKDGGGVGGGGGGRVFPAYGPDLISCLCAELDAAAGDLSAATAAAENSSLLLAPPAA